MSTPRDKVIWEGWTRQRVVTVGLACVEIALAFGACLLVLWWVAMAGGSHD